MTKISRGIADRASGLLAEGSLPRESKGESAFGRAAESDSLAELASEPVVR